MNKLKLNLIQLNLAEQTKNKTNQNNKSRQFRLAALIDIRFNLML